MGPYSQQNGTATQRNWSSYFHNHQSFESRNLEAKKWQKYHSLQWRFHENKLSIQAINSVNQVSIYAAVTNWCCNFALKKEEKEHILTPANDRILAVVEPEEVDMLTSSPNPAQGNLEMQSIGKEVSHDTIMREGTFPASYHSRKSLPNSTR